MALTTTCCFNSRPPTAGPPTTTQPPLSTSYVKLTTPKREISWRDRCVVGIATVIIGLQMEGIGINHDYALAMEPKAAIESKAKGKRWSGKRMCPAWQLNSLETIVPEDLPRPSHKRRWEGVGDHSRVAPPVKSHSTTITAASSDCFSM